MSFTGTARGSDHLSTNHGQSHGRDEAHHFPELSECVSTSGTTPLRPLLCLTGPTASGKSAAAYALARRWGTEIVAADSRQLYLGMTIGTDQPPPDWQRRVVHHLVGVVPPDQSWNAGRFCRAAEPIIEALHRDDRIPIVVGGTGLYLRALLYGLMAAPPSDPALRRQLADQAEREGAASLHDRLRAVDPASADTISPGDCPKLIRALEIHLMTGRPKSAWQASHGFQSPRYDHALIGLRLPRPVLHRRIEERVGEMVGRGLVEEARRLWEAGYDERHNAMRGLGYRQLLRVFRGEWSIDAAVDATIRETKRYAKRQMTWFRRQAGLCWLDLDGGESAEDVAERLDRMAARRWGGGVPVCYNGRVS
ncbi:MAG TPA: tRNA (adenosine(37)-N6)-dimethylallyltransferase MiaA [Nitrospiria bacterium]|nr:tRNA (adenosine(37)-N6)-dimethylallyltransferase MiaA [Nitrospiria bacterium]